MRRPFDFSELPRGRGYAASRYLPRIAIRAAEHDIIRLPAKLIRSDGTLNLYPDVVKLFRPIFDGGIPSIQCGGWVGYIPLNEEYALEVSPRVPIGNLERLIGMASGYGPRILHKYSRRFSHSSERPDSLFDVLADQLLDAFDRVWENGLLKTYDRRQRIGATPFGRIDPFKTAWRSIRAGIPTAASSAFYRTADFAPNRVLFLAFQKLLSHYNDSKSQSQRARILRIRKAVAAFDSMSMPSRVDLSPEAVARAIWHLPTYHEEYADALMLAQVVVSDSGFSIRNSEGGTLLPSIVIDMAKVFEAYVRRILADYFRGNASVTVKDGNVAMPTGAKTTLFDPVGAEVKNVPVTPDIVIEVDGVPRLIIDAKYKPSPEQPDRKDVNQVVMYGARYGANRVVLIHAGRGADEPLIAHLGNVGAYSLYNARADLSALNIEDEEKSLGASIATLIPV